MRQAALETGILGRHLGDEDALHLAGKQPQEGKDQVFVFCRK